MQATLLEPRDRTIREAINVANPSSILTAFRALDHIIAARRSPAPNGARTLRFLVSDRRSVRLALYRVSAL